MTGTAYRGGMGWGARLLIGLALILVGAAAATWGLANYQNAARFVGLAPPATAPARLAGSDFGAADESPTATRTAIANDGAVDGRIAALEQRLAGVESATERAEGSAGRADSLVVAFAARRAVDRGVALGYLEKLLVERFGSRHPQAVAAIVTGARRPVRLNDLIAKYDQLGSELRRGVPGKDWWAGFKRELGSLIQVRSADSPSPQPDARYERAMRRLQAGDVDQALAETMRMPGAAAAQPWIDDARRYVGVHRALDEIESAALMPGPTA